MEKQNVTLSLPKTLLKKAKHLAVDRGVSLNELVRELLREATEREEEYRISADRQKGLMERGFNLGTKGRVSWTRDELYQR